MVFTKVDFVGVFIGFFLGYSSPWTKKPQFCMISGMAKRVKSPNLAMLGGQIKTARKALSWSQEELAHRAGLDRSYIGGVERGERNVTFTTLCQIAAALKTNASTLSKGIPNER
jgi:DNA-binding XRE family transcriptional regulator